MDKIESWKIFLYAFGIGMILLGAFMRPLGVIVRNNIFSTSTKKQKMIITIFIFSFCLVTLFGTGACLREKNEQETVKLEKKVNPEDISTPEIEKKKDDTPLTIYRNTITRANRITQECTENEIDIAEAIEKCAQLGPLIDHHPEIKSNPEIIDLSKKVLATVDNKLNKLSNSPKVDLDTHDSIVKVRKKIDTDNETNSKMVKMIDKHTEQQVWVSLMSADFNDSKSLNRARKSFTREACITPVSSDNEPYNCVLFKRKTGLDYTLAIGPFSKNDAKLFIERAGIQFADKPFYRSDSYPLNESAFSQCDSAYQRKAGGRLSRLEGNKPEQINKIELCKRLNSK